MEEKINVKIHLKYNNSNIEINGLNMTIGELEEKIKDSTAKGDWITVNGKSRFKAEDAYLIERI